MRCTAPTRSAIVLLFVLFSPNALPSVSADKLVHLERRVEPPSNNVKAPAPVPPIAPPALKTAEPIPANPVEQQNDKDTNKAPEPPVAVAAVPPSPTPDPHNHHFEIPNRPLTDEDRERLIDEFCRQNNIKRSDLTKEQHDALIERFKFLEQHRGHEQQHAEMALILFGSLIVFQIVLTVWKKWHPNSFNLVSLLGLWFVPAGIGLSAGNLRFIGVWTLFSLANGIVVRKAIFESPMQSETPKLVYRWYSYVYQASVMVGAVGYFFTFVPFFSLPSLLFGFSEESEISMFRGGVTILFYALYFGMLGRDFVDRLSDRMAMMMGYFSRTGFPRKHLRSNVCAICGESTNEHKSLQKSTESVIKMNCGHPFHEDCIRGWTIIGKKDCCPYCKEKVDMKAFSRHAWDSTQLIYLNFLDALRYLLVWNPVVFVILHFVFKVFGFK